MSLTKFSLAIILAVVACAATASAATPAHYFPKRGHSCRAGFVRHVVRVHRVRRAQCLRLVVKVKATPTVPSAPAAAAPSPTPTTTPTQPTPAVMIKAGLDPTFTQDPTNPLKVTWNYSATAFAGTTNLGTVGQLPPGVLEFYTSAPGQQLKELICSMNVGGSVTGGTCTVTYPAPGDVATTVHYIVSVSATNSVTETDIETIKPYTTTTAASAALSGAGCHTPEPDGVGVTTYACDYTLTAAANDQNGNALSQPLTFTLSPVGAEPSPGTSYDKTFSMPAGQSSCTITVVETTPTGTQAQGGAGHGSSSEVFSPSTCSRKFVHAAGASRPR